MSPGKGLSAGPRNPMIDRGPIVLAAGMLLVLVVLLVPLPPMVLDLAISLNLSMGLLVLLLTMNLRAPLDFSTFPSLLLFTTLYRLALNVASTRLILGGGDAGRVIASFGDFVVGGNLVVGLVIFIILITIQFVVITKGSNRISEVAARFTLDAMPGKQMAIDADLNAGLLSEADARERRDRITSEAEFYGAMDGAGKFVRGDAIAGLIITLVNIVGGVGIGVSKDMEVAEALRKYAILTVGDGLVSQIPALVIAIAAGLLVTKTQSEELLGREITSQFLMSRQATRITAGMVLAIGLVPGLPLMPFLVLSVFVFLLGRFAREEKPADDEAPQEEAAAAERSTELTPEALGELMNVDRLSIQIGYRLIPMVDEHEKGGLLDHINMMRRQFATQYGFVVPPIRVRDDLTLEPNRYRILIGGDQVAAGELHPDHVLAMDPGTATGEVSGIATVDPTFGLPATWVPIADRGQAELHGLTVIDPASVLITHLTEVIKEHAHEILSREDVQAALDRLKETHTTVVEELVPDVLPLGTVQKVLSRLLKERVPIRNLPLILESLADAGRSVKDADALCEEARQRMARTICELHGGRDGRIAALTLDPGVEQRLIDGLGGSPEGARSLTPAFLRRLQDAVAEAWTAAQGRGCDAVLLVRAQVRRNLADLLASLKPPVPVLSYNEVVAAKGVESVGTVALPAPARTEPSEPLASEAPTAGELVS